MNRITLGKILLTFVLVLSTGASFVLDWRSNHLLSPAWHPHARFHGGLLLFTLAGVSATGVWLLWRRSLEPLVAVRTVTLIALSYWTPLFYVNSVVPGSSLWAGEPGAEPRWLGHIVYPNLVAAAGFAAAAIIAWAVASRGKTEKMGR